MTDQHTEPTDNVRALPLSGADWDAPPRFQALIADASRLQSQLQTERAANRVLRAEADELRAELQRRDAAITKVRELVEELKAMIAQQYRDALERIAVPILAAGLVDNHVPDQFPIGDYFPDAETDDQL